MIGTETGISLGVLIGTAPLLVGCAAVWFKLKAVEKTIKNIWSIQHQRIFAERLENRNQRLHVPDINEVLDMLKAPNGKTQ